ncbi:MAG: hypothetical protein DMG14_24380 [Acidobacteria bacterium]|nr:MAG: hypothetical protein DMG14_24380 [Acidobacteriota bacterium]
MAGNALRLENSNSVFRPGRAALAGPGLCLCRRLLSGGLCLRMGGANPGGYAEKKCESEKKNRMSFH